VLSPPEAAVAYAGGDYMHTTPAFDVDTPQSYISTPAPSLSRTPARQFDGPIDFLNPGEHSRTVLAELGLPAREIDRLVAAGIISDGDNDGAPRAKL
jgi:crotonobetainyl-CoA:carnitine CoA-transferase CaiB-like acyl-CoA transferase